MKHPRQSWAIYFITHRMSIAAFAATVGITAACAPFHRGASDQPATLLYFTNESLDQADVFAVLPGNPPIRIGTVMAGQTDTLTVPRDLAARGQNVNVVARLLARSTRPSSGPLPIHPGDRLTVRLPVDEKLLVVLPGGN
jgi:hypothetical protein